ncbi:MAG TPA: hypothetical protein VFP50_15270 [Anaeromyxobacteraceae bacterium]|nr:hypothetical protein [Anaeromyxobacteraceae bacterium]
MKVDEKRLMEIEGREKAATAGKWDVFEPYPSTQERRKWSVWAGGNAVATVNIGDGEKADAEFIAASREDVPDLAADLRDARTELQQLRAQVAALVDEAARVNASLETAARLRAENEARVAKRIGRLTDALCMAQGWLDSHHPDDGAREIQAVLAAALNDADHTPRVLGSNLLDPQRVAGLRPAELAAKERARAESLAARLDDATAAIATANEARAHAEAQARRAEGALQAHEERAERAEAAVLAEREACARAAESRKRTLLALGSGPMMSADPVYLRACDDMAAAIRARGAPPTVLDTAAKGGA